MNSFGYCYHLVKFDSVRKWSRESVSTVNIIIQNAVLSVIIVSYLLSCNKAKIIFMTFELASRSSYKTQEIKNEKKRVDFF